MPSITLNTVSFSYGSRQILNRVNLHVAESERVFIIGPNGSGKTTLLKVVSGELSPTSGQVVPTPSQHFVPDPNHFVGQVNDYFDTAFAPVRDLSARFNQILASLSEGDSTLETEYDHVLAEMTARDVWSLDSRLAETLTGLGLNIVGASLMERSLNTLSPGQLARLRLAALLVLRPNALILDEPTNHLDADAVSFLSDTIRQWDGPVLVSSHDRAFIEETATIIYDTDIAVWSELAKARGENNSSGLFRSRGNYSDYLTAKKTAQEKHAQIHSSQQSQKRKLQEHRHESMKIARGGTRLNTATGVAKKFFADRASATSSNRMRSDEVRLNRLKEEEVHKPRSYKLQFPPYQGQPSSGIVVSVRQASIVNRLLPIDMDLSAGEHLLITGRNGTGKSTLLNWIATGNPPIGAETNGSVSRDDSIGIVPQNLPSEGDTGFNNRLWQQGVGELGQGILHPSMWATPIPDLSAGNQRRAQLAIVLAQNPSILIMDEPTNYLDLDTMQALEKALRMWKGTLIIASHDRWLINHWHGRQIHLKDRSSLRG
ncbi:ABC-F family ATP-binding cassette domain-containing protein [Rothia sp. P6271]|uniref:ABC-F family ATP-binding cassette domain-containing protein n=1 Tax=Rothia sp. P6271 TaxID=3402659 RepID=UPI003AD61EA2